jgi:hypothetical protein
MKVGLKSFLVVGVMAVIFIAMAKIIFTKYEIPGVSKVVQAV